MIETKQKCLFDKYPSLFVQKDLPMSQTCMCWGLDCDEGWYDLIDRTCAKVIELDTGKNIQFTQVKEKFAGLRIYFSVIGPEGKPESKLAIDFIDDGKTYLLGEVTDEDLYDKVQNVLTEAERESFSVCEACGQPGEICKSAYWYKTLCQNCRKGDYANYKPAKDPYEDNNSSDSDSTSNSDVC